MVWKLLCPPVAAKHLDIKLEKGMEYWFYYMPPTPNKIWEDKGTANFDHNTSFFRKNWTAT